ncbi:MAG: EamA family transporter, partial [Candidatus Amesbacteria bacterium]|nr:EamA family transporter [Candidatus Amesbacteria bacterium]
SLNGFFYVLAVLPYFYALQRDEASIAVPLFQMVPVFSLVLGYFILGETLTSMQLLGGTLIISGAIFMSLDLTVHKKIKLKKEVFLLMALSSFLFAINFLFFKYFAINARFWVTSFWEYVGFAIFASLLLVFVKSYRNEFFKILKTNKISVLTINGINEVVNIIAKASFNFASLLAPVTLIWIVNGLQPLFVFIFGVFLTLIAPKISQENISRKILVQKMLAIVIMFIGAYLINK